MWPNYTLFPSVRPTNVDFLYDGSAMAVNQEYQLTCLAFGSQPAALITWWIDDVMIPTRNYITKVNAIEIQNLIASIYIYIG